MADETFVHEERVARPIAEVWAAITLKAHVDRYYFAPLEADLTGPEQAFYYGSQDAPAIIGRVLRFEPPNVLSHSFSFAEPEAPSSIATYQLFEEDGTTRVRVEHVGYAPDSQPYADIAMGWPIILSGLKAYLEAE